ncbi:MAG: CdaR family protein [Candidatus Dadabacteria bacterium]|nr:CdaR family protein [Candidatus Dadabacteria bacterium]
MGKKPFFQGLAKKTIALALAVLLWAFTNFELDVERDIRIPLHLSSLPENLIIVNKLPESVDLSIRGPRNLLSSFAYSNKSLPIDLQKTKQGVLKIDLQRAASETVPRGIDIVAARPARLSLSIDRLTTKRFRVKPVLGEPDSGYEISNQIKVVPRFVEVKGPASQLAKLETIETAKIKLEGEAAEFTVPVQLQLPTQYIEVLEGDHVNVTVKVKEIILTKEFRDIDIIPRNFGELEYSTTVPQLKASLVFNGPYKTINDLASNEIKVYIDGAEMGKSAQKSLNVKVDYPDSNLLKLTSVTPKKIRVKVKTPPAEAEEPAKT